MKTYKVYLRDYAFETVTADNFAVDDQNNLVVGQNLFHNSDWKRITFLYESDGGAPQAYPYDYDYTEPVSAYAGVSSTAGSGLPNW